MPAPCAAHAEPFPEGICHDMHASPGRDILGPCGRGLSRHDAPFRTLRKDVLVKQASRTHPDGGKASAEHNRVKYGKREEIMFVQTEK